VDFVVKAYIDVRQAQNSRWNNADEGLSTAFRKGLVVIQIAIDGTAGAGKSTIAKILADRLGYIYIDTGAMYRAITYAAIQQGLSLEDGESLSRLANITKLELVRCRSGSQQVIMNNQDVSEEIRSPLISQQVSLVASHHGVREALVHKQQEMANSLDVVMDGRDIGTVVLPNADVKLYLTASLEERARRRYQELQEKGYAGTAEEIMIDMEKRDHLDQNRAVSPLCASPDAVFMDTTDCSLEKVLTQIVTLINEQRKGSER